jgi:ferric-dicitrate binding protein FerR (iron transport regulator)
MSELRKTLLSYLLMAVGLLAFVLATQVIFEWSTSGLKWITVAAFAVTAFVSAGLHYLLRLCQARDGDIRGDAARTQPVRSLQLVALAGSLVVGVALAFVAQNYMQSDQVVSTEASEWQHRTLPDGTVVHVDAHSKVEVEYSDATRIVHVHAGSAAFEVAKDPKRPFIARTDLVDALAVGTRFGVAIDQGVTTTVSEGKVKVTKRGSGNENAVMVRAGQELRVSETSPLPSQPSRVDAEREFLWTRGLLDLSGMTIAEGVRQLNRRNRIQIMVESPALAARTVEVATVNVDSPESYAKAIARERGVSIIIDKESGIIRLSE